ncbi:MarR family winged helix-turn-helix transcriptional regulator [Microbacterium sp. SD291]|uniref:MarR family winged helix-turn-helix transcriptional regulator n=1 Tax=Microbacterium sp. SD291 TaxID=2782007 RepID=UPI001A95651A|nr:MarR family transcriptional regulator [Microbacterium sp. SD291]MBO0981829.1 MarR family transcriptional regulator [Microbacterium sp. SD291]
MDEAEVIFLERVVSFETRLWNRIDRELASAGKPSLSTLLSLRTLARFGHEGRVHDLSTALSITVGAASKLVDRMERAGLARRRPHPGDRRSSLIELTAQGEEVERDASTAVAALIVRLLPDAESRAALMPVMEVLESGLQQSDGGIRGQKVSS